MKKTYIITVRYASLEDSNKDIRINEEIGEIDTNGGALNAVKTAAKIWSFYPIQLSAKLKAED